ncbi:MAG: ribonuclease HII [Eubacteriales bacterium]
MPDYSIERKCRSEGYSFICGVDEAGRGPLCGPVFAAACILPDGLIIDGLNDSKKLSEKKREALFDIITEKAIAFSVASASVEEIDRMNILEADLLAMRRAIDGLSVRADYALIDGNICRGFDIPARAVIKGDSLSMSISAASVLAKVSRDRLCAELDCEYPMYGIAKNKGYGTKDHIAALTKYGPSPIHRKKFIRFLDKNDKEQ